MIAVQARYFKALCRYSVSLSYIGKREESYAKGKQAVKMGSLLVKKNRDRYEPGYAKSLRNYASHLSDVGQYVSAMEKQFKAIDLIGRFYQKLPRKYGVYLGGVYFNMI